MEARTVSVQEFKDALGAAVAARGADYCYASPGPGCLYWHGRAQSNEGEPGCIIGWALHHLGVPKEFFEANEGGTAHGLIAKLVDEWDWDFEDFSNLVDYATRVQIAQDDGVPWGEAILGPERRDW